MKIDWKLKGWNLLKFGCNTNAIIHPETCADVVKIDHDSEKSLTDWITSNGTISLYSSLSEWFTHNIIHYDSQTGTWNVSITDSWDSNYEGLTDANSFKIGWLHSEHTEQDDNPIRIPYATKNSASPSFYGLVKAGNGLDVSSGVFSVGAATANYFGGVKLGYPSAGTNRAVQLNSEGRAFVEVGNSGHTINQWGPSGTESYDIYNIPIYVAFRTSENPTDPFLTMNLLSGEYGRPAMDTYFDNLGTNWGSGYNFNRCFPVMRDTQGVWYTYVPYPDAPRVFSTTRNGLVPMSGTAGDTSKFLKGDGSWATPQDTTYSTMGASGSSHAGGLVPDTPSTAGTAKYLREDGTWSVPPDNNTVPRDKQYVAKGENDKRIGLLELNKSTTDVPIDSSASFATAVTPTVLVPIIYSEIDNNSGHCISLDTIVSSISTNSTLLNNLVSAISNDTTALQTLVNTIADDDDILELFFTPKALSAFNTALDGDSEALDGLKRLLGIS